MATFISLVNFTDQGIRSIKESPDRATAFKQMAEKAGLSVKAIYYTVGSCDMVVISEGSDEAATAVLLKVGSMGNSRSQTLRGFSIEEMRKIIAAMP
jgi:uncharacterized protein with GYD domain